MTAVSRHTPHPPTLASTVLRPWKENKPNTILGNYRGRLYVWCSSHPPATCTVMFIFKPWSQRPTWLNSTQLAAELSCKEWSHHLGRCDHSHNSTKIVWFFVCRGVLNKFRISKTSWVESDRAAWSHEKLQLTNWVRSDASLFVTASVAIFNLSAISWTAFLFFHSYICTICSQYRTSTACCAKTRLYQGCPTTRMQWLCWSDITGIVWFLCK